MLQTNYIQIFKSWGAHASFNSRVQSPWSLGVSCRPKLTSAPSLIPGLFSELQPAEYKSNPRSLNKRTIQQSNIRSWLYGVKSQIFYFDIFSSTCDSVIAKSKNQKDFSKIWIHINLLAVFRVWLSMGRIFATNTLPKFHDKRFNYSTSRIKPGTYIQGGTEGQYPPNGKILHSFSH